MDMVSLDGYEVLWQNCLNSLRGNREPDPIWSCKILKNHSIYWTIEQRRDMLQLTFEQNHSGY